MGYNMLNATEARETILFEKYKCERFKINLKLKWLINIKHRKLDNNIFGMYAYKL